MKIQIRFTFLLLFSFALAGTAFAQLQSPEKFLGYPLGDRFTPHHKVMDYVHHVAGQSRLVTIQKYGETYEHRDLVYLVVTSPQNHEDIEEIRLNNLKLTGLEEGEPTENQKAILWLSYNVHGNEASSSEAAMKTLYELARTENREARNWLRDAVVIMDPMLNPDGRDRYVNWYNGIVGAHFNPDNDTREHDEPWPGGRSNHYYFDLNRDWAWQTQKETQQRIPVYQHWMPHIHVDFHEQSYNSPYYFAPAAEPYHTAITDWQIEFQTTIGQNNASYFDEEGWHYFTGERFDLFYPSYGDTWPTFNGSIGMTYEQAGSGVAGLGIKTADGDTLTLKDRLTHHYTTGMSTIEVTAQQSGRVISEFASYFENARNNAPGRYKTFVVKADNHPDKIYSLLRYLDNQQIEYGLAGSDHNAEGYDYKTGRTGRAEIQPEDILISTSQPNGQLARVLFEPNPQLSDSLTYDITSWEFHYSRGLSGYALEDNIAPEDAVSPAVYRSYGITGAENPYAYLVRWNSMDDARFLAEITQKGVKSRYSAVDFELDEELYKKGTLIITAKNNEHLGDSFHQIIQEAAENNQRQVYGASTGFVATGSDFGSPNVAHIEKPNIAVLIGEGTSSLNAGEIWHFFDQQLFYPAHLLDTGNISQLDLAPYNVLILPSGSYGNILNDERIAEISSWVQRGGTLIAIGQTNSLLAGRDGFLLQQKLSVAEEPSIDQKLVSFGERNRRYISSTTSGATYQVELDTTHPLAFGYDETYFSLKMNADAYEYLDSGWNVGSARFAAHRSGFVGHKAKPRLDHSLVFGVQEHGRGHVIYMIDNPLFRGFWENGKLLFTNALFFVK